jgi:hypothetical protein
MGSIRNLVILLKHISLRALMSAKMLVGSFLILSTAVVAASYISNPTQESCNSLYRSYPNSTFFPGSARYTYENTCKAIFKCGSPHSLSYVLVSWSATAWLGPACVFCPFEPAMVSHAVQLFSAHQVPFAIRGGGAMPVDNAANIGPEGILISSSNFTMLNLSDDRQTLSVGAGIRWPDVYTYLEPHNVIVNGIRIGDVGVVGFILGGGIGFFSYEYGLAATHVRSFEVCYPPSLRFRSDSH